MPDDQESRPRRLSFRWALVLFALLVGLSLITLQGTPLYLSLIIVAGLALKTYLGHLRDRINRQNETQ